MECARHLQASYVDQPVLTPLLAWVSLKLFGVSLLGLRMWPALAAWATVVVAGLMAREFGGGRRAQLLAALATATMPVVLGGDHLFGPTAFDILAWAALALVVAGSGGPVTCAGGRWRPGAGAGAGQQAQRGLVRRRAGHRGVPGRRAAAGAEPVVPGGDAAIAVAFTIPDIWWQAQHQWATIAMSRALAQENGGAANIVGFVIGQLVMSALALVVVWVAGLRFLWRSGRPLWRALVWAYAILFVFFALTTGGKIYYLAGAYIFLLAAGAVAIDGWLAARAGRLRRLLLATALCTALAVPLVLPVLPPGDVGWTQKINPVLAESVGWPQLVGTVRTAWFSLPAAQRASAVIFASNYGEASAINALGGQGLPQAVSGHNTYWWWGPGNPRATTVVAVMPGPADGDGDAVPRAVLHQRASRRDAVQPVRAAQPGVARPRLPVHRPAPPLGPDVAAATPVQLTGRLPGCARWR